MGPSEIDEYFLVEPLRPLRLTLASGDQIIVRPENRPFVSGLTLVLNGDPDDNNIYTGHRLISIPNIALAEPLSDRPRPGRRRR